MCGGRWIRVLACVSTLRASGCIGAEPTSPDSRNGSANAGRGPASALPETAQVLIVAAMALMAGLRTRRRAATSTNPATDGVEQCRKLISNSPIQRCWRLVGNLVVEGQLSCFLLRGMVFEIRDGCEEPVRIVTELAQPCIAGRAE